MSIQSLPQSDRIHYRTIFLSDIHLGSKGCQAARLANFLKFHSCDRLYLVGDIIDGWRMKSSGIFWPLAHTEVLRNILSMTKHGTEVVYVTGNHDEFLRRYSELKIGNVTLVDEAEHTAADGARYLVVHGDQFDVITRYHRWLAFLGDVSYQILLNLNLHLNRLRSRFGYGFWSLSAWLKYRVKSAVNFISDFEQAVVFQCRKRDFAGVICGHIHHAEIADYDGIKYMNCGDWVESCTALVENAQGQFRILRWRQADLDSNVVEIEPQRLSA